MILALGLALLLGAATPAVNPALPSPLALAGEALGNGELEVARAEAAKVPDDAPAVSRERARLIGGVSARALGDFSGAVKRLDFSGAHLGDLEAYHQLALGDARFYAGDAKGAVAAFAKARDLSAFDAFTARASGRLGDALLASGQPCPAAAAYQVKLGLAETPARLDALSRAQAGCGDAKGARATAHRLWLAYAEHPAAAALEPAFAATAKPDDRLARALRLLAHAGASAALPEVERGLALHPRGELAAKLLLLRGKALSELRRRADAQQSLELAVRAAPRSDTAAEARMALARAAWRRGELAQTQLLFEQVAKRHDRQGDDAAFLDAYLPFDRGNYKEAAARFDAYLAQRPRSRKADEAAWFSAYAAFRAGDRARAHDGFERLAKRFPGSPLLPQALYWQARTSTPAAAEALYRGCIRVAPVSFYAAMARLRLAELGKPPEPPLPSAAPSTPKGPPGRLAELAQALSEVGLWADRGEALDAAIRATRDPDQVLQLAAFASSLGEWGRAYALANRSLWHQALDQAHPDALAMLFPRAYPELVARAAAAWSLDPAFAWAIMRRESAFDPSAESGARAVGLMQMLAPTARKIAGLLGRRELPTAPELHRPQTEIPLAAWYLAALTGRFGHAALAAAAYNAGPRNVMGWLDQNGKLPFDEFVEAIPFRETRRYVKNVVGDYLTYRALYPSAEPALPLDRELPEPLPGAAF